MIKVDKIAESSFFSQKNIAGRGFGFGFASCGSALKFYLMPKRSKLLSKIFNSKIIYSKKVIEDWEYHKKCGVCSCDTFFNHLFLVKKAITGMRVLGLAWDRVRVRQVAPLLIMK